MPPERNRLSDEEVRRFIRQHREVEPAIRHTRLLKLLREGGFSCEQARFKALFVEETAGRHAR
jgi:hypothetical protein